MGKDVAMIGDSTSRWAEVSFTWHMCFDPTLNRHVLWCPLRLRSVVLTGSSRNLRSPGRNASRWRVSLTHAVVPVDVSTPHTPVLAPFSDTLRTWVRGSPDFTSVLACVGPSAGMACVVVATVLGDHSCFFASFHHI